MQDARSVFGNRVCQQAGEEDECESKLMGYDHQPKLDTEPMPSVIIRG
jgi:hypothetical protein